MGSPSSACPCSATAWAPAPTRPFINLRSHDEVTPGMVVALGTHLYRPGLGGMRLEYPS